MQRTALGTQNEQRPTAALQLEPAGHVATVENVTPAASHFCSAAAAHRKEPALHFAESTAVESEEAESVPTAVSTTNPESAEPVVSGANESRPTPLSLPDSPGEPVSSGVTESDVESDESSADESPAGESSSDDSPSEESSIEAVSPWLAESNSPASSSLHSMFCGLSSHKRACRSRWQPARVTRHAASRRGERIMIQVVACDV